MRKEGRGWRKVTDEEEERRGERNSEGKVNPVLNSNTVLYHGKHRDANSQLRSFSVDRVGPTVPKGLHGAVPFAHPNATETLRAIG